MKLYFVHKVCYILSAHSSKKDLVYYRRGLFLCLVILLYNKIMANILPENETVTFEDQTYVNPETSLNEQNTFIDNLRASQARQNAEIQQQTQDLGTAVPSNLGGLVGGEGYFTSRYQTPQTNALVEQLRSTAQAQALSDVLSNQQAMWKQRYNEAYKSAQRRAAARASTPTTTTPTTTVQGGVDETVTGTASPRDRITLDANDLTRGGTWTAGPYEGSMAYTDAQGNTTYYDAQGNEISNSQPVQTDMWNLFGVSFENPFAALAREVDNARRQAFNPEGR